MSRLVYEMEYCDVTMKTQTNLCRNIGVHTKPLNRVSIHKNVSCVFFYNTSAEKYTTLMNPVVHILHLEVIFIFHTERALHIKKNQTNI